jgi:hypothetical protein
MEIVSPDVIEVFAIDMSPPKVIEAPLATPAVLVRLRYTVVPLMATTVVPVTMPVPATVIPTLIPLTDANDKVLPSAAVLLFVVVASVWKIVPCATQVVPVLSVQSRQYPAVPVFVAVSFVIDEAVRRPAEAPAAKGLEQGRAANCVPLAVVAHVAGALPV